MKALLLLAMLAQPVELEETPLAPPYPKLRWGVSLGGGSTFLHYPPTGFFVVDGRIGSALTPHWSVVVQPMFQVGRGNAQTMLSGSLTALAEATVGPKVQFALGIGAEYGGRLGSDDVRYQPGVRAAPEVQWRFLTSGRESDWDEPELRGGRTSWSFTLALRAPFDGRAVTPQLRLTVGLESY